MGHDKLERAIQPVRPDFAIICFSLCGGIDWHGEELQ